MDSPDEGLTPETSAFESLYGGQFTLLTQLIKPSYFAPWLSFFIKYDMPVDFDEIVNRPPPEDDAIVNFALRIVL